MDRMLTGIRHRLPQMRQFLRIAFKQTKTGVELPESDSQLHQDYREFWDQPDVHDECACCT
jgi:hypothetical protein